MTDKMRQFVPNWKILALSALLLPVLLLLGNWQLSRSAEKQQILAQLDARTRQPVVPIETLIGDQQDTHSIRYRVVRVTGSFDNRHNFLLDNRVRQGRPGYEVITPLYTDSGQWLLVNRGWIAAPQYRHQRPAIPEIKGPVQLTGNIYTPLEKTTITYDPQTGWPNVIQSLDFARMGESLGHGIAPLTVRLRDGETGSLQTGWPAINVQPHKHIAYAVQWFSMALALLVLTFFSNFRRTDNDNDQQ